MLHIDRIISISVTFGAWGHSGMAIIKIMRLISLPDPGHICGRREKRKENGMEREENATRKRILSRFSPVTPCDVNKQNKKTCPLFWSGSLPRCYINAYLFFRLVPLWEPWTASLQQNISLLYTDLDLEGHVCFKNILYKVVIPHLLIAFSLLFQPTEKAPKPWWF